MTPRDPKRLFARYGRQLLVTGAEFDGQARLHGWCAALAGDGTAFGQAAAEACARYLVGAGVGSLLAPTAWATALQQLDPQLVLLDALPAGDVPTLHASLAQRPDGAAAHLALVTQDGTRTVEVTWQLGAPAGADAAVVVGAHVAGLLLEDVLGLQSVPGAVVFDLRDPAAPTRVTLDAAPPSPLAAWRASATVWPIVAAEAERCYPDEACGLILRAADGHTYAVACANLQDRYHTLDPDAFPRTARTAYSLDTRAIAQAEQAGATVLAIWHTHCDASAYFSAQDQRGAVVEGEAVYPGVAHVVVSVVHGVVGDAVYCAFDATAAAYLPRP